MVGIRFPDSIIDVSIALVEHHEGHELLEGCRIPFGCKLYSSSHTSTRSGGAENRAISTCTKSPYGPRDSHLGLFFPPCLKDEPRSTSFLILKYLLELHHKGSRVHKQSQGWGIDDLG